MLAKAMTPQHGAGIGSNLPRYSARRRPFWRTLLDAIVFAAALTLVVLILDRFGMIDVGRGNAQAKDGDSLVINDIEVRLYGIDAPELNQSCGSNAGEYPCGREAKDALRGLLRNKIINCKSLETDRYGRAVSICWDGKLEINSEMVRQGWAIAYFRHATAYAKAQKEARATKRGIWRGRFEMPENYRAHHRPADIDVLGE
jgi:endonuclease YncB( thermonuclease family)